jgi:hypothetical protein
MTNLQRYWFKFEKINKPTPLNLGCGVTACDQDDAICLMRAYIFSECGVPTIVETVEGVQASDLEKSHVLPNIGNMDVRGIWFPQGYEESRG